MKYAIGIVLSAFYAQASSLAAGGPHHKAPKKWEMTGVYSIRYWPKESVDSSPAVGVQMYRRFAFRKLYDSVEQRYRVDAYPISPSDEHEFPIDSAAGSRSESPLGAFVVLADHEGLYLIEDSAEGEVECRRLRRRFQKQDPNLKAKYRDLVFEHNELCNHYTDLQGVGGSNCKFTNTDLWLDAFTHDPVAMHLEGLTSGPKMGGFDHKKEMKHRFVIDLVVNEFEEHIEDEKEWLSMPHNVRQLCHAQESAVDYESPLAVEQESLLAALEL